MDPQERDERFPSAKVFCNPKLLTTLQNSPFRSSNDSKSLVDMELKMDPEDVLELFQSFPDEPSRDQYNEFVDMVFEPEASSKRLVRNATPMDFNLKPPSFLNRLQEPNEELTAFAIDLKMRWVSLCREFVFGADNEFAKRSSFIPLPFQFFVPGGRFRECFYWDTLWIVKGLIACDMLESAKAAVRNLFYLVSCIGFVPNGNRVYFLNRTQPPLLTEAVKVVYDAIDSASERVEWLEEAVPILDKESSWIHEKRSLSSHHPGKGFENRLLSLYYVSTHHARPESFAEDSLSLHRRQQRCTPSDDDSPSSVFQNLAAAAESGWDFSSRWFPSADERVVENTQICSIVPVCLNSILLKAEKDLSSFHELLANHLRPPPDELSDSYGEYVDKFADHKKHLELSSHYKQLATRREADMMDLLWDKGTGFWFDYDIKSSVHSSVVSCAGLMPLWAGCNEKKWTASDAKRLVAFVSDHSGLLQNGGLSCTTQVSKEQWDFPNSWPPLIDLVVEGMQRLGERFPTSQGRKIAQTIASRFLETAWRGWREDNVMHEKYDSRYKTGKMGVGGEYAPQVGFGWTNGSILRLLCDYAGTFNDIIAF
ncbi:Trehalase [Chondrus crispus]|uniref:Trehalase n=1 Tax=Chondrus crispus TaxID=2769 RepID=R7QFP7_CHOCR|nr:Trehalase [Chondrus crispus]CDF36276.1 Trehalase [Chondrus crispus]|eukprot:XP_005716095.1 Trehalase [Chondrus crispus]